MASFFAMYIYIFTYIYIPVALSPFLQDHSQRRRFGRLYDAQQELYLWLIRWKNNFGHCHVIDEWRSVLFVIHHVHIFGGVRGRRFRSINYIFLDTIHGRLDHGVVREWSMQDGRNRLVMDLVLCVSTKSGPGVIDRDDRMWLGDGCHDTRLIRY